jgi:parallel beta-helix repeat protein
LLLAVFTAGTAGAAPDFLIEPGPNAQEDAQEALILAQPGQTVAFAAGTFQLKTGLSLTVDRVTVRGAGEETVLDFSGQDAGSEGLLVTSDGVLLEGFTVQGTPGDAIKVRDAKGITFRSVRAVWPGEPKAENGAYGLYPVGCQDVLIEDCYARGASDAGIYVGQSRRVIVRRCTAEQNVAGIEIENSRQVDVYENTAVGNTGGILVFDLPDLPVKGGGHVRVFENRVEDNDTPNFAPAGNIVASGPRGTGMLVMANREVEIFKNTIGGHRTTNVLVLSYLATGRELKDADYDPFPAGVHLHDNTWGPCGEAPAGMLALIGPQVGLPLPSVVWDGIVPPDARAAPVERVCLGEEVEFLNLDLARLLRASNEARPSRDAAPHRGSRPSLEPARLEGSE